MTTIQPTDRPILWTVTGDDLHIDDLTPVGALTGVNPALSVVSADGEAGYLAALTDAAVTFPALPDSGRLEAGDVYDYLGTLVIVRQSHNRTEWPPQDTPALFVVYRPDAADVLEWVVGESVLVGTLRTYESDTYRCTQAHVTQADWTPPAVPALWALVPDEPTGPQPWVQPTGAHDAYHLGDLVTYQGWIWECTATDGGGNNVWAPGVYGWTRVEPI